LEAEVPDCEITGRTVSNLSVPILSPAIMNLNSKKLVLTSIKEITMELASKIFSFREKNGVFVNNKELLKAGVPPNVYDEIKHLFVCNLPEMSQMDTTEYRKLNLDTILGLEERHKCKFHVGHIVAHKNGGSKHPDNYDLLPGITNMKLQHRHDDLMFMLAGKERTAKAVLISRMMNGYPLTVEEAEQHRLEAIKQLEGQMELKKSRQKALKEAKRAKELLKDETDAGLDYPAELDLEKARVDQGYCEYLIGIWNELAEV